ncbi:hypothetical protein C8A01DRAFT_41045 [Parachaetomium inaequale]|uniref:Uncharacterized protein n=1 Tax=Parachaetomium inaequale TaxID=2588326 RepID=A0AAN6SLY0_9PEZI|nr:hypothetical protein C8A01DRAFT_41045 [Parachaetomium inaequale]
MSPASSLYNLMVPKPKPPPYNKVAKLAMTVEVETVQLRARGVGGPALETGEEVSVLSRVGAYSGVVLLVVVVVVVVMAVVRATGDRDEDRGDPGARWGGAQAEELGGEEVQRGAFGFFFVFVEFFLTLLLLL